MTHHEKYSRRKFVATTLAVGTALWGLPQVSAASVSRDLTIAQVIDLIKGAIPFDYTRGTVDTVKSGDISNPVTGIVTTMFATVDVIRKANELKANLIIAHEPTFYNHLDETDWLNDHEVYQFKRKLLEDNGIVVWRFHDLWHTEKPDGILMGVLTQLGWEKYYNETTPALLKLPATTLGEIIQLVKNKLDITTLRFIGDRKQVCSTVAILPGASGGRGHMNVLKTFKPDLLIVGELQEWETSEYVRDLRSMGADRSLIVLGHAVSEEPGMFRLVDWLQPKVPGVKIHHIPSNNPFTFA